MDQNKYGASETVIRELHNNDPLHIILNIKLL